MAGINYARVKELVSMSDVLGLLGWQPSYREPTGLRGYCPLHSLTPHTSRTFAVSGGEWYCFRCEKGGDQLRLYRLVKRLANDYQAAVQLCKALHHKIPWLPGTGMRRPRPPRNREEER